MSSDSAKENASVVDSSVTEWRNDIGNSDDPGFDNVSLVTCVSCELRSLHCGGRNGIRKVINAELQNIPNKVIGKKKVKSQFSNQNTFVGHVWRGNAYPSSPVPPFCCLVYFQW